jgi:hypothetical protein
LVYGDKCIQNFDEEHFGGRRGVRKVDFEDREVDRSASRSYPVASFDIGGVEPWGAATTQRVKSNNKRAMADRR